MSDIVASRAELMATDPFPFVRTWAKNQSVCAVSAVANCTAVAVTSCRQRHFQASLRDSGRMWWQRSSGTPSQLEPFVRRGSDGLLQNSMQEGIGLAWNVSDHRSFLCMYCFPHVVQTNSCENLRFTHTKPSRFIVKSLQHVRSEACSKDDKTPRRCAGLFLLVFQTYLSKSCQDLRSVEYGFVCCPLF